MYHFFYKKIHIADIQEAFLFSNANHKIVFLLLAIILFPINWLLESYKWKLGMKNYLSISIRKAFESVLVGVTIGSFTPGRVGEYGGRLLHLSKPQFAHSAWSTFLCSITQNICNILFGLGAFLALLSSYQLQSMQKLTIISLVSIILIVLFIIILNFRKIPNWLHKIPIFQNWIRDKIQHAHFEKFDFKTLLIVQFIAAGRYFLYIVQFALVIYALTTNISIAECMLGAMTIYLFQTILPLTPLMEFSIRGGLAIVIFQGISNQEVALTLSSYSIWVINLLIPASLGAIILLVNNKRLSSFQFSS